MAIHCERFIHGQWCKEMAAVLAGGCLSTCPAAEGSRKERAGCTELILRGKSGEVFQARTCSAKTLNIPVWGKAVVLILAIFLLFCFFEINMMLFPSTP